MLTVPKWKCIYCKERFFDFRSYYDHIKTTHKGGILKAFKEGREKKE